MNKGGGGWNVSTKIAKCQTNSHCPCLINPLDKPLDQCSIERMFYPNLHPFQRKVIEPIISTFIIQTNRHPFCIQCNEIDCYCNTLG